MARQEILRQRSCAVVGRQDHVLLVRLQDPSNGIVRAFPPGGGREEGESFAFTAERECLEETGYRIAVRKNHVLKLVYSYPWNGKDFLCHSYFFSGLLLQDTPATVRDASYNQGAFWCPREKLPQELGFHREILAAVLKSSATY